MRGKTKTVSLVSLLCFVFALLVYLDHGFAETASEEAILRSRVARIVKRISSFRGLELQRPLHTRVVSSEKMVDVVRARVRAQYTADELLREGQVLASLGLIESPESYERRVFELIGENIAGYYDPESEHLYVERGVSWEEQQEILIHETTHALQDQHFDLGRILDHRAGGSDRLHAASAVVEGDATAVAMAMTSNLDLRGNGVRRQIDELARAILRPAAGQGRFETYLRRTLAFSYAGGLSFVHSSHRRGGWEAIDELLRRPPSSTAVVLHPHRRDLEEPNTIPLSVTVTASSCRPVHEDVMGELLLREMLAPWIPRREAATAVAGWGGDRAILLDDCPRRGEQALLMATLWKSTGQGVSPSERFRRGLIRALVRRHGVDPNLDARGSSVFFTLGQGRCSFVSWRGPGVVYVEGAPCDRGRALAEEAHLALDSFSSEI